MSCLKNVRSLPEFSQFNSKSEKKMVTNQYHWDTIATNCNLLTLNVTQIHPMTYGRVRDIIF